MTSVSFPHSLQLCSLSQRGTGDINVEADRSATFPLLDIYIYIPHPPPLPECFCNNDASRTVAACSEGGEGAGDAEGKVEGKGEGEGVKVKV